MEKALIIAVGSKNPAKLDSVRLAFATIFPGRKYELLPLSVPSGVPDQPLTDEDGLLGAQNRARSCLETAKHAEYGIGLEGTLHRLGDHWMESGWCVVRSKDGREGIGTSARFELPATLAKMVLEGKELADVMKETTGRADVRSTDGAMGVLTDGRLGRAEAYSHSIIFAMAPFLAPKFY